LAGVAPQRPGHLLAEMTWPEVAAARQAASVVIVPLGSCEQHGRGMALQTDTVRAVQLAKAMIEDGTYTRLFYKWNPADVVIPDKMVADYPGMPTAPSAGATASPAPSKSS